MEEKRTRTNWKERAFKLILEAENNQTTNNRLKKVVELFTKAEETETTTNTPTEEQAEVLAVLDVVKKGDRTYTKAHTTTKEEGRVAIIKGVEYNKKALLDLCTAEKGVPSMEKLSKMEDKAFEVFIGNMKADRLQYLAQCAPAVMAQNTPKANKKK